MQADKLLLLEEIPEHQLLSDNCSPECSSLQGRWGHFPLLRPVTVPLIWRCAHGKLSCSTKLKAPIFGTFFHVLLCVLHKRMWFFFLKLQLFYESHTILRSLFVWPQKYQVYVKRFKGFEKGKRQVDGETHQTWLHKFSLGDLDKNIHSNSLILQINIQVNNFSWAYSLTTLVSLCKIIHMHKHL